MRVNPKDGRCRSCGGELTIIDADDATMTVECDEWMSPWRCLDFRGVWVILWLFYCSHRAFGLRLGRRFGTVSSGG
jgi:hypothetical protein